MSQQILEKVYNVKKTEKKYNIKGKNNIITLKHDSNEYILNDDEVIDGLNISINGNNNEIIIGKLNTFRNSKIVIGNDNVKINIGIKNKINCTLIRCCFGESQIFKIGDSNVIIGANFMLDEKSSCFIGNNNLFSDEIRIWCTDGHSIYNLDNNELINIPVKPVIISDHCWIGQGVHMTKNAELPCNTIVGLGSCVTKKFTEKNTIIAGNPAKVVKKNVNWHPYNTYHFLKKTKNLI